MSTNSQLLLRGLADAAFMLDADGYIVFSNRAAAEITGFSRDELANKHLSTLYNNDSTKSEYELSLAKSKGKWVSETWRYKKDGTRYWGELTLAAVYDDEHNLEGYTALLRDTSEKKQVELELRQSEERYRLMVEGVREYAIFLLDEHGNITTWNDGAKRIKGYSANEIIGRHFSTFYTSEDLESKKPERELVIATQTGKYEEEGWRVRKNGSVFWANVVITALFTEQNKLIGFSKVTRDLTERKENEEWLRQSEERYRLLVEQVTDYGIFMMDEKGRITSWNEGAKNINGYTSTEIIGKYFSIFYPEEDLVNGKPQHELRVAKAEGKYEEEGWRVRKDGTRFWASVVITAVYNHEGTHMGYSKVTRDLTERKAAERALRDSHDRYRSLTEELRHTNSQLTSANRELEQFTSIVSHDLQEPIRTIKSFLQLIDMKVDAEQQQDLKNYIGKSINAANRMRQLILNLLQYSQLGKTEVNEDRVLVTDVVNEALQNLRTSVEASEAEITIESDVEYVDGDRVQLVQLLQNLIANAVKFTNGSTPRVKIRCYKESDHVKFAVSDNGIGIATKDLEKVFQIFRRLNPEKEYPGTGIGLAICKKIVDRHGGRIWPESEPGKGTTFYFTLNEETQEPALS